MSTDGLPSLLMEAARSAAVADGLIPDNAQGEGQTQEAASSNNTVNDGTAVVINYGDHTDKLASSTNSKEADAGNVNAAASSDNTQLLANSSVPTPSASNMNNSNVIAAAVSSSNSNTEGIVTAGAASAILTQQKAEALTNSSANNVSISNNSNPSSSMKGPASVVGGSGASDGANIPTPPMQPPKSSKKGPALRRGKWTSEEEAYANRLIQEFKAGLLPLTDGTTLRTFLSKLLNCDPMRISKKFVGSNCIGKQVFRRRTADINRLTPDQIQQSRNELSELERRFLERVAQTNRVKSGSGSGGAGSSGSPPPAVPSRGLKPEDAAAVASIHGGSMTHDIMSYNPNGGGHTPPWMRAPTGYHPTGNRAAAAGRALLQQHSGSSNNMNMTGAPQNMQFRTNDATSDPLNQSSNESYMAMAEIQRRLQQQNQSAMYSNGQSPQQQGNGLSGTALAQIARNASAARMATHNPLANSNVSFGAINNSLHYNSMGQLNRVGTSTHNNMASHNSLASIMDRQSSFDALMSLDIQSLQSIDNLANLIQSGTTESSGNAPRAGMKNWSMDNVRNHVPGNAPPPYSTSNSASALELQDLIRTLSHGNNLRNYQGGGNNSQASNMNSGNHSFPSNASFANHSMNTLQNAAGVTNNPLQNSQSFGQNPMSANYSQMSLNSLLRHNDSSTGLTALRMQDGLLNQRNTSVDDFLSLVANGDIPHQDPHMLNVPLHSILQQQAARQQMLAAANGNFGGHHNGNSPNGAPLLGNQNSSGSYLSALTAATGKKRKSMDNSIADMDVPLNKQFKNI